MEIGELGGAVELDGGGVAEGVEDAEESVGNWKRENGNWGIAVESKSWI
jgi:hypothetical protein